MNCGQAKNLFGAYWDDELTQAEREWLESHFASCPACRGQYEELARTLEAVGDLPRVEVSPGFAERALAAARRRSPAVDRMPIAVRRWVPITATAVLLAVLTGMVMQWSGMPLGPRRSVSVALDQPVLVEPTAKAVTSAPKEAEMVKGEALIASDAEVSDSLFDHSEDVEFILDPVTLRKGRAHTIVRMQPEPARGEQAVITF
jgi:predicted anti-sigma-YlaC factor YlaD